jgi:hypothetical protein
MVVAPLVKHIQIKVAEIRLPVDKNKTKQNKKVINDHSSATRMCVDVFFLNFSFLAAWKNLTASVLFLLCFEFLILKNPFSKSLLASVWSCPKSKLLRTKPKIFLLLSFLHSFFAEN